MLHRIYSPNRNSFHILTLTNGTTAVGFLADSPPEGLEVLLTGEWKEDPQYGRQFRFTTLLPMVTSASKHAVVPWLQLFKGIGEKKAEQIWKRFGRETIEVIRTNPDKLTLVPGISQKTVDAIRADLENQTSALAVYAGLEELGLVGEILSPNLVDRIIAHFKDRAIEVVKHHPYQLTRMKGVGFATADRIARELHRFDPLATERVRAAVHFTLRENAKNGGHTCYPFDGLPGTKDSLLQESANLLFHGDESVHIDDYDDTTREELLSMDRAALVKIDGDYVYSKRLWEAETHLVDKLHRWAQRAPDMPLSQIMERAEQVSKDIKAESGVPLDDVQIRAAAMAIRSPLSLITGPPGSGKCLAPGTPVMMFDGTVQAVEDILPGQRVMGWDSTPRTVFGLDHGVAPMYRIVPTKGDPFTVTGNHILVLKLKDGDGPEKTLKATVKEFLTWPRWKRERSKLWRRRVDFPAQPVPMDPYLLGVWLGDGNNNDHQISNPDPEIIAYLAEQAEAYGLRLSTYQSGDKCPRHGIVGQAGVANPMLDTLRELDLLHNKHVPAVYLYNDREVRRQILAGLLDTDGSLTSGYYDFITKDHQLAKDVAYLARSLGLAAYIQKCQKSIKAADYQFTGTYYRLGISGDLEQLPLRVVRKQAGPRRQVKNVRRTGFTVEPLGDGEYFGFETDGDHMFLLGDFTVTHNTTLIKAVTRIAKSFEWDITLCAPTGKASRRLAEATGHSAATVHRTLGAKVPRGEDELPYDFHEDNPLRSDLTVCDESSMNDLLLGDALIAASELDRAHLLLVGDIDQLPSVGPGRWYGDLIDSRVFPVTRLSKVYRQREGSQIAELAVAIRDGYMPDPEDLGGEVTYLQQPNASRMAQDLTGAAIDMVREGYPLEEVQILVPSKKGKAGAPVINYFVQQALGPIGPAAKVGKREVPPELQNRVPQDILIHRGDRVRQTKNNYTLGALNGDIGAVEWVDPTGKEVVVRFVGLDELIIYHGEQIHQLDLAYALTTHASQGSEWKCCLVGMHETYYRGLLQRNLFYTGVSRAKSRLILMGTRKAMAMAVRNNEVVRRHTRLAERLRKAA